MKYLLLLFIVGWIGCKGDGESKESVRLYNDSILRWIDSFGVSPLDTIVYRRSMLIDTTSGLDYKSETSDMPLTVPVGSDIKLGGTGLVSTTIDRKVTKWTDVRNSKKLQEFLITPKTKPDTIYIYRDTSIGILQATFYKDGGRVFQMEGLREYNTSLPLPTVTDYNIYVDSISIKILKSKQ